MPYAQWAPRKALLASSGGIMSLLDVLEGLVDDKATDWLEQLVDAASERADDHLNGPEADLAKIALRKIGHEADALAHLGHGGLLSLLTRVAMREDEQAQLTYLTAGASFEERRAASHAATADAVREGLNRERAWESVLEMLKGLGKMLWRVIPLLLAA